MLAAPIAVVAYADILHELLGGIGLYHRYGECLNSSGCGNPAAVAVGLFAIVVILLKKHITATVHGGEETYGRQVCR